MGVSAWRHDKVIFQLLLVAVIDHFNSWIDILDLDFGEKRDCSSPLGWIITDEIIHFASEFIHSEHLSLPPGSKELQPNGPGFESSKAQALFQRFAGVNRCL